MIGANFGPDRRMKFLESLRRGESNRTASAAADTGWEQVRRIIAVDPAFAAQVVTAKAAGERIQAEAKSERSRLHMTALREQAKAQHARTKRGWCAKGDCGRCRSCAGRKAATTKRARGYYVGFAEHMRSLRKPGDRGRHSRAWTATEEAVLRKYAGVLGAYEIAERLRIEGDGPVRRTYKGVRSCAERLDLSLWVDTPTRMNLSQLAAFFGCAAPTARRLIAEGRLPGRRYRPIQGSPLYVEVADIERLLREQPWAYNPALLAKGRLGDLGRVIHRADGWLSVPEIVETFTLPVRQIERLLKDGTLPYRRRVFGSHGAKEDGIRVVRRADVRDWVQTRRLQVKGA